MNSNTVGVAEISFDVDLGAEISSDVDLGELEDFEIIEGFLTSCCVNQF